MSGVQGRLGTWCSSWAELGESIRSPWVVNMGLRERRGMMSGGFEEKMVMARFLFEPC